MAMQQVTIVDESGRQLNLPECVRDLEMIFATYSQEYQPSKADPSKCGKISQRVQENAIKPHVVNKNLPTIEHFNGITTRKSYDEALTFYEAKIDTYREIKPFPIDRLIRLELWFIQIMEPPPANTENIDIWKNREHSKCRNFYSHYCPADLRIWLMGRLETKLPRNWRKNYDLLIEMTVVSTPIIMIPQPSVILPGKSNRKVLAKLKGVIN